MKVLVRVLRDSHNTDTKGQIAVEVKETAMIQDVVLTLDNGRELTVPLNELQYAIRQPT